MSGGLTGTDFARATAAQPVHWVSPLRFVRVFIMQRRLTRLLQTLMILCATFSTSCNSAQRSKQQAAAAALEQMGWHATFGQGWRLTSPWERHRFQESDLDAALPYMRQLGNVRLICLVSGDITETAMNKVASLPHVTELQLMGAALQGGALCPLQRTTSLQSLDLRGCSCDSDACRRAIASLSTIRTLNLYEFSALCDDDLSLFAQATKLER